MTHRRTGILLTMTAAAAARGQISTVEFELTDPARDRTLAFLAYLPDPVPDSTPLILVSHGGTGGFTQHRSLSHLGTGFAEAGYVAVHIGHRPSSVVGGQTADRPADVSFLLDAAEQGALPLPAGVLAAIDLARVGLAGQSYGAYTAHAVAGATYDHGVYRDERVDAIVPISPQGAGQFGADAETWRTVSIPTLDLVGELEIDTNVLGTIDEPGWRLTPFRTYRADADRLLAIVPGAGHIEMGIAGNGPTPRFVAQNAVAFFDVYLRGDRDRRPQTGTIDAQPGTVSRIRTADSNNDGDATTSDFFAWVNAFGLDQRVADVNADGHTTASDFFAWIQAFGEASE